MNPIFMKAASFGTAVLIWLGTIFSGASDEGVFKNKVEVKSQSEFDEGEFVMGEFDIVVSPKGDDENPGTLEQPMKTPEGAKERVKAISAENGKVTVWFREGIYSLGKTLSFEKGDRNNVVYRSYPGENVVFSGAKEISNWKETKINGVKAFVSAVEIKTENDYFRTLYKSGKSLPRSKYPKEGAFSVAQAKDEDRLGKNETVYFNLYAAFYAQKEEIKDFKNVGDVDVRMMHYWCDELMPISSVDTKTGRIEVTKPASMNISEGDKFVYENVRETLSDPEEWYLDRSEKKLYYIPTEGETVKNTVLYAGNIETVLSVEDCSDIEFQGIEFGKNNYIRFSGGEYGINEIDKSHPLYKNIEYQPNHPQAAYDVNAAVKVKSSKKIAFTDCSFRNLSNTAIKIYENVSGVDIESCDFDDVGANAIFIHGERKIPATTNNIKIKDCEIQKYGRNFNNAVGILLIDAADCEISHNEIHDGWYTGVSVGWVWGYDDNPTNGIQIQNNLIYNIGNGWLSDMGAIYTLGKQPDTVISGNVIYNVGCYDGSTGYGGWGIYLDEGSTEITVETNLVYDCSSQGFHQHYGKDNLIKNNIFAFNGDGQFRITRQEEHNSLYLYNNIFVGEETLMYKSTIEEGWFTDGGNLYWDYKSGGNVYSGDERKFGKRKNIVSMNSRGYYNDAVFEDPLFKDPQNRDFTLADNTPATDTGFVPWQYDAGLFTKR